MGPVSGSHHPSSAPYPRRSRCIWRPSRQRTSYAHWRYGVNPAPDQFVRSYVFKITTAVFVGACCLFWLLRPRQTQDSGRFAAALARTWHWTKDLGLRRGRRPGRDAGALWGPCCSVGCQGGHSPSASRFWTRLTSTSMLWHTSSTSSTDCPRTSGISTSTSSNWTRMS